MKAIHRNAYVGNALEASRVEEPDTFNNVFDDFLREASERTAAFNTTRRVVDTVQALETIARHMAGRPGRKNLIWVSAGFPFAASLESATPSTQSYSHEIRRAARAINQANLAVYPVDARGLISPFDTIPSMSPSVSAAGREATDRLNARAAQALVEAHTAMRAMADRTGGRAFINTNDMAGAIRRAVDDSQVTYNLAFAPDHNHWDGRFREIKVAVRREGLELHYRRGYQARLENGSGNSEKARLAEMALATSGPLEATGLSLTVRRIASTPRLRLQVRLDPREVDFQQRDGRWVAGLDILVAFRNEDGAVLSTFSRSADFNLKPETHASLLQNGISLSVQCESKSGSGKVRVVVRDMATGQIGSVDVLLN